MKIGIAQGVEGQIICQPFVLPCTRITRTPALLGQAAIGSYSQESALVEVRYDEVAIGRQRDLLLTIIE